MQKITYAKESDEDHERFFLHARITRISLRKVCLSKSIPLHVKI